MRNKFIDYAKGFSIFTIVVFHLFYKFKLSHILFYAINFGGAGVHLFFFASGYGLVQSNYTTYFKFLKKRMVKVLVPYYIAVSLIFFINIFIHLYPAGLPEYLSHLFLYKMFVPAYETSFGGHFWFISTIVQFYLVFPLLLWALNSGKNKTIFAIALSVSIIYTVALSLSAYAGERIFNGFFIQYLWEFVLGMIISRLNILDKIIGQKIYVYLILAVVNIALTGLLAVKGGATGKNLNDIFSFTAYFSVVVLVYRLCQHSFLRLFNSFVFWVYGFSFSLYLIHMFIFDVAHVRDVRLAFPLLLITLVISYLYDKGINKIINPQKKVESEKLKEDRYAPV